MMAPDYLLYITVSVGLMKKILIAGLLAGLTGCFRPAIPISTQPNYPVDVFYENQRPDLSFEELQKLENDAGNPGNQPSDGKRPYDQPGK